LLPRLFVGVALARVRRTWVRHKTGLLLAWVRPTVAAFAASFAAYFVGLAFAFAALLAYMDLPFAAEGPDKAS
jgi:hypothetical protein